MYFIYYFTNAGTGINRMYFPVSERKIRNNLDSGVGSCVSGLYGCAELLISLFAHRSLSYYNADVLFALSKTME